MLSKLSAKARLILALCLPLCCLAQEVSTSLEQIPQSESAVHNPVQANEGLARDAELETLLQSYFASYQAPLYKPNTRIALSSYRLDTLLCTLEIKASEGFGSQNFTPALVDTIYNQIRALLPPQYAGYRLRITSLDHEISQWIANLYSREPDPSRNWGAITHISAPHIQNISRPYTIEHGLEGRHLALWASHGRYFSHDNQRWQWQRPPLYCSVEDLLTPSIVIPYLMPMLENAGAVIFSPRERDPQPISIIVDNEPTNPGSIALTERLHHWQTSPYAGYGPLGTLTADGQNPMTQGSALIIRSTADTAQTSSITWLPDITEEGDYGVYVAYQSFEESTSEAIYEICHSHISTLIKVNQQMGGGIWTYLGTFHFTRADKANNYVRLTNYCPEGGIVSADALRLGGGMGQVARGDSLSTSGLPAFMEGARYAVQAMGFPESVYNTKDGRNDYADDINARSNALNYLSGGSVYNPDTNGLRVPICLSVGIHTDAGQREEGQAVGTLCISTPADQKGDTLLPSGLSRMASSDLAAIIQNEVCRSMRTIAPEWPQRELYHRNYSETRLPAVPSVIVEMLSHQNFTDMELAHAPQTKFLLARAVYKGILRFIACASNTEAVVQPLPPSRFKALLDGQGSVVLSWEPAPDSLEPTATPSSYVVYTQIDGQDFDNGRLVDRASLSIPLEPGTIYNFRVCALNSGGLSFPSEQLAVMWNPHLPDPELIVAQYPPLSGPQTLSTPDSLGFLITSSAPVPYQTTYEYAGYQTDFSRSSSTSGQSTTSLVPNPITGNTYNQPLLRGRQIAATTGRSFHSIGVRSEEGGVMSSN